LWRAYLSRGGPVPGMRIRVVTVESNRVMSREVS
jgi:hypothetical protein